MHIKVSHESPIALLQQSVAYNDFDYCLVHLMETHEAYRDYFLNARSIFDREVFLDNSIFELGKAFNPTKYMDWAEKIKPNMFVIPDVLDDGDATMKSWDKFIDKFATRIYNLDARKIGVVHGKSLREISECYSYMSDNADIIALSFDMQYFKDNGEGQTGLEKMCRGRTQLIEQLIEDDIWNWNKPHHLLGCSLPQEFSYYVRNNIHNIRSVDTSSPIVHGLHNVRYNSTLGLKDKVKQKLADLIDAQPTTEQQEVIRYNIDCFRRIVEGEL